MSKWYNVFQPIYQVDKDLNVTISHYEMLLRDENDSFPNNDFFRVIGTEEENQKWILAEKESIDQAFAKYPDICINLNIEPIQFAYPSVWKFIENIYSKYGKKVVIEVTERQLQAGTLGNKQFDKSFQRFHDIGLDVVLDDVDSGGHSFTFVDHHSDIISGI
ncbi:MAG: EAL domain-containing protein, partial [Lactobacillus crispatus]|nr:EAL domain-containing protein [Lactobacillus crispatus]